MARKFIFKKIHVNSQTNYLSAMKKRIYLLLLSFIVIFSACRDDSGKFVEQLFTDTQITYALRDCIEFCSDSTLNTLCMVDTIALKYGYYDYDLGAYRIEFPAAAQTVIDTLVLADTLALYEYKEVIDSLIFNMNKAATLCGNKMKSQFWNPIVKEITFPNPNLILHGGNTALTNYIKEIKQTEWVALLVSSIFDEQCKALNVVEKWDELQAIYSNYTGNHSSIDILTPAAQQMVEGFFKKMASVEEAVRKDPNLRGKSDGWFYKVFETL
jgi:hypothetical protein